MIQQNIVYLATYDLKLDKFTHADADQIYLYLNYAKEHWTREGKNLPVGLIFCTQKNTAVAHYALDGLSNKVLASKYRILLSGSEQSVEKFSLARKILERKIKC